MRAGEDVDRSSHMRAVDIGPRAVAVIHHEASSGVSKQRKDETFFASISTSQK
jgi:hypothetical protein